MKYVITDIEEIFVFSDSGVTHKQIGQLAYGTPVSGGFCQVNDDGTISVWGNSVSLGLKNRGDQDAVLIEQHLFDRV